MSKKLSAEEKHQLNIWSSEFKKIENEKGNNPFRYNVNKYVDRSDRDVKNADQYIYDMWVNIEFKQTFDFYFYQMLLGIKTEIEKKNG